MWALGLLFMCKHTQSKRISHGGCLPVRAPSHPDTTENICVAHHVGLQQLPQAVDVLLRHVCILIKGTHSIEEGTMVVQNDQLTRQYYTDRKTH